MLTVVGSDAHDCNVLSLFTNSKLFQRLLCIGVDTNELCKLQLGDGAVGSATDTDDHWTASLNGQNIHSRSAQSSDTEAMEYEDIDRYLVTMDSAAVAKDMMERGTSSNSMLKLKRRGRPPGSYNSEQNAPSPSYKDHDPDYTVGQKLSLKIKRRYKKHKKTKPNLLSKVKEVSDGDDMKLQKTRVVKIIDPGKVQSLVEVHFSSLQNLYVS